MEDRTMWGEGKRLAVFSVRDGRGGGSIWVRAGYAVVNRDRSLNVVLDVLPLNGRLHVRETAERRLASAGPDTAELGLEARPAAPAPT